jgi:hypothetical protein
MFDHDHYVPILRWKAGEKRALRELFPEDKRRLTPLIEWSRPGEVAPKEDRESPTPEPPDLAHDIMKHWGTRPFFCDLAWFWTGILDGDVLDLRRYAVGLANSGLRPIPVLTLGDAIEYRSALASLISGPEVCLRLHYADLAGQSLARRLNHFFLTTGHTPATVHVIADFNVHYRDLDIAAFYGRLPHITLYRTLTVAAGSFPLDLREFKGPQTLRLPRHEWVRYQHQVGDRLQRQPTFGDYAMVHPVLTKSARGLNPSATIRYTIDDAWLVMKGEGLHNKDGPGYHQYHANALLLMQGRDYRGPEFSAGDTYISEVAARDSELGNPTTWVQAGVNHHLTFVSHQVEEFFGGAAALEAARMAPMPRSARVSERVRRFHRDWPAETGQETQNREEGGTHEQGT